MIKPKMKILITGFITVIAAVLLSPCVYADVSEQLKTYAELQKETNAMVVDSAEKLADGIVKVHEQTMKAAADGINGLTNVVTDISNSNEAKVIAGNLNNLSHDFAKAGVEAEKVISDNVKAFNNAVGEAGKEFEKKISEIDFEKIGNDVGNAVNEYNRQVSKDLKVLADNMATAERQLSATVVEGTNNFVNTVSDSVNAFANTPQGQALSEGIQSLKEDMANMQRQAEKDIGDNLKKFDAAAADVAQKTAEAIASVDWDQVGDDVNKTIADVSDTLGNAYKTTEQTLNDIGKKVEKGLADIDKKADETFDGSIQTIGRAFGLESQADALIDAKNQARKNIKRGVDAIGTAAKTGDFTALDQLVDEKTQVLADGARSLGKSLGIEDQMEAGIELARQVGEVGRNIRDGAIETAQAAGNAIHEAGETVYNALVGVWNFLVDLFSGSNCLSAAEYYSQQVANCYFCDLYNTIFDAVNHVATNAYKGLHLACLKLLAVSLGLWILFFTGKYLFSFAERKPQEYIGKLFNMLFKAMIVAVFLSTSAATFSNYIVSPIIVTATEYGLGVMESFTKIRTKAMEVEGERYDESDLPVRNCDGISCEYRTVNCSGNKCEMSVYTTINPEPCRRFKDGTSNLYTEVDEETGEIKDKLINAEINDAFKCMISTMHYETSYIFALANAMLCHSWKAQSYAGIFKGPSFEMLITALCILLVTLLICFVYIFKLVDIVLRLGVLLVLLPVLAVAFVFPITLDFAKKGLGLLIHISVTFVSLILVLSLSLMLVTIAFTGEGGQGTLISYFNENKINEMKDLLDFSTLNFLFAIITLVIALKILGLSEQVASEFSSGMIGSGAGDALGATSAQLSFMGAQSATRLGKLGLAYFAAHRDKKFKERLEATREGKAYGHAAKAAKYQENADKRQEKVDRMHDAQNNAVAATKSRQSAEAAANKANADLNYAKDAEKKARDSFDEAKQKAGDDKINKFETRKDNLDKSTKQADKAAAQVKQDYEEYRKLAADPNADAATVQAAKDKLDKSVEKAQEARAYLIADKQLYEDIRGDEDVKEYLLAKAKLEMQSGYVSRAEAAKNQADTVLDDARAAETAAKDELNKTRKETHIRNLVRAERKADKAQKKADKYATRHAKKIAKNK